MSQTQAKWRPELSAMVALAIPVVLSELGWVALGIVDTIMVGSLGPAAIGAVALSSAICFVPAMFGMGILLGLDTLVSQAYGRGDHDDCHRWMAQGVYLGIIVTLPIMALIGLACFALPHLGIAPEVARPAASYMNILNWGTLPLLIYGGTRRYLQSVGVVREITVTLVVANLLNWFGNWVLIYGKLGLPALGVDGSAISTVLSRIFMGAALLFFAWRYERQRGHSLVRCWEPPRLDRLQELLRIGFPAAGQILLEVGAWSLVTVSASWLTPVELATQQIVFNYSSLSYVVPLGVSAAAAVSVGRAVGAGDAARARRAGWLALAMGTGFMLLAAIAYLVAPRPLIALYTHDPQVMAVGPGLFVLVGTFQIFDGIQTVSTGALRGMGETRIPMLANLVGYWLLGLPMGLTLCFVFHWGLYGLWSGLTLALIVIALILLRRWRNDSVRMAATD
jgi:MATE family multidrug resistance protein